MNLGPLVTHWPKSDSQYELIPPWECAYCGSLVSGEQHKCPNCGAPYTVADRARRGIIVFNGISAADFERMSNEIRQRVYFTRRLG